MMATRYTIVQGVCVSLQNMELCISQIALDGSVILPMKLNWGRLCSEHCMEFMIREGKVKLAATDHVSDMRTFCPIG